MNENKFSPELADQSFLIQRYNAIQGTGDILADLNKLKEVTGSSLDAALTNWVTGKQAANPKDQVAVYELFKHGIQSHEEKLEDPVERAHFEAVKRILEAYERNIG